MPSSEFVSIDIPEVEVVPGRRLGRNIRHDPASLAYEAEQASTLKTVQHVRHGVLFDQGNLGSCTGNALGGALMTEPLFRPDRVIDEGVCRMIYALGTRNDSVAGVWPSTDTGSSGLGVCKAAKNAAAWLASYGHTFSAKAALAALMLRPGIMGMNWYSSFDEPGPEGLLTIAPDAYVRGGHEMVVRFVDVENHQVGGDNSWGPSWGTRQGRWLMSWDTFGRLLDEQGDMTFPVAA